MSENKRDKAGMTHRVLSYIVLMALVIFAGLEVQRLAGTASAGEPPVAGTSGVPIFEVDPAWPKVPSKWKLGDVSSMAVDAQDRIWVLHRPRTLAPSDATKTAPPVLVFDSAGNFIKSFGGAGNGYEWPEREHGIHIDYKGFIWIGGNNCPARNLPGLKAVGDDQYLKFTQDGKFVMQIGHSNKSSGNADTKNLQQPADAFVYRKTNEIFIADGYGNHRVIVFDADTGAFKRMWGAFGNVPADLYNCPPPSLNSVPPGEGPPQFSIAHAIRVSDDGLVYVADRENRRVQVFTIEGKFVKQLLKGDIPFARDLTLSPDPEQQFLYVGGDTEIVVVDRKTLEIVESIKGGGVLGGGHQMATDSKGNIYTAQTNHGLQKLAFKGMSPPSK
jgi:DNA-binding beta-propeller fold protein YncE